MFRGASLNTQPIPADPPTERRGTVVPWCWPAGARMLLAVLALAVGLGLKRASWDVPSSPPTGLAPHLEVDANTAPPQVLAALPQIGPALVSRLVEARNERPFTSLDDLGDRVRGVGPVTLARLKPYLHFASQSDTRPEPGAGDARVQLDTKSSKLSRRKTTRTKRSATGTISPGLTAMASSSQSQ